MQDEISDSDYTLHHGVARIVPPSIAESLKILPVIPDGLPARRRCQCSQLRVVIRGVIGTSWGVGSGMISGPVGESGMIGSGDGGGISGWGVRPGSVSGCGDGTFGTSGGIWPGSWCRCRAGWQG
jgi:hypothetical protein